MLIAPTPMSRGEACEFQETPNGVKYPILKNNRPFIEPHSGFLNDQISESFHAGLLMLNPSGSKKRFGQI